VKKQLKKLALRKETLLFLDKELRQAAGQAPSDYSDCGTTTSLNCGGPGGTQATSKTPSCNNMCTNEN
jgi:hypothetical protein